MPSYHAPVLLDAIVERGADARRVVDATLGDGGHAAAFLARGAEVLGIDRDPDAIATARQRLGDQHITYLQTAFASSQAINAVRQFHPDFVLLDLGVSSRQFDQEDRGFTFRQGAPLDMRMGPDAPTAAEWINTVSLDDLTQVMRDHADEPRARTLAAEIVRRRDRAPFQSSDDLVNAIRAVLGARSGPPEFARIFQAVRIAVNGELEGLETALPSFRDALTDNGILAVISYHSGEDRLVKRAFRDWEAGCQCPPRLPQCVCGRRPLGAAEPRRAILPLAAEIAVNPRARSAKLRFFRVDHAG